MKKLILSVFLLFSFVAVSLAQRTITGTVSDVNNEPLIGASVLAQGTSVGTVTDIDGSFALDVSEETATLEISYTGFATKLVNVSGLSTISVQLEEGTLLEEVVVLGYVSRGKNQVTGNVVQIEAQDIAKIPAVSIDQSLQGKVPGLNISSSSGTPGSNQDIRIRGVGSITASNAPLYVIDGVPVISTNFNSDGDEAEDGQLSTLNVLASLNSEDIESMTVLKDAAATAAYGARGSNGVIVITTKKGRGGKTKFSFSSSIGYQNAATEGPKPLTGAQREELFYEALYNSYGEANGFTREEAKTFAVEEFGVNNYKLWDEAGRKEGNWGDEIQNKNAGLQNYTLSASGSDEKSNFYASIGYNKTDAITIGSGFKRLTGKLRYGRNFRDNLKFGVNVTASNMDQKPFYEQSGFFANPYLTRYFMPSIAQPYNEDGSLNLNLGTSIYNTLYLAENDKINNTLTRGLVSSFLEYEVVPNLKLKSQVSLDANFSTLRSYANRVHGEGADVNGSVQDINSQNVNTVWQNSASYKYLTGLHSFDFTGLVEYQKNRYYYSYGYGENIPADDLTYLANTSNAKDVTSLVRDWYNASYLGMINYNYDGKYIADLTYRREGSSRFPSDKRFGDFYALGLGWNLHREAFMEGTPFSTLRLRGSYGISGNSGIEVNTYQSLIGLDADYNGQGAGYPLGYGNPSLTWEKNKTFDLGVDFGFLNDRITGSIAYFNKFTYDLLQEVPLTRTSGFNNVNQNLGEVLNQGIEASLDVSVFRNSDWDISLNVNAATLDNEVKKLAQDANGKDITITSGTRRIEVGKPINSWYMRGWAGVNPETGEGQWYVNGTDGEVTTNYNEAEVAFQGKNAIPAITAGLSPRVSFKGAFVEASLYYAGGHKVYEDWARYFKNDGLITTLYYNGTQDLLDRWQKPGDVTDYPAMVANATFGRRSSEGSSRFLYDGDYIRLRQLSLGYTLPNNLLDNVFFSGATIAVRGTNLWTWVKDDRLKWDPEVRANGFTRLSTPPVKSVILSLNLNF